MPWAVPVEASLHSLRPSRWAASSLGPTNRIPLSSTVLRGSIFPCEEQKVRRASWQSQEFYSCRMLSQELFGATLREREGPAFSRPGTTTSRSATGRSLFSVSFKRRGTAMPPLFLHLPARKTSSGILAVPHQVCALDCIGLRVATESCQQWAPSP